MKSESLEIKYTGNEKTGKPTYYEIEFHYLTRMENKIEYYLEGSRFINDVLLAAITINYGNQTLKTFELEYNQGFNNRLINIKVIGLDGITYLNPIKFEWGNYNYNLIDET